MAELAAGAVTDRTAIMCSESVWWRCHRRLIADHACLIEQLTVCHVMPDGRLAAHGPTAGVRVRQQELVYDRLSGTDSLPFPGLG